MAKYDHVSLASGGSGGKTVATVALRNGVYAYSSGCAGRGSGQKVERLGGVVSASGGSQAKFGGLLVARGGSGGSCAKYAASGGSGGSGGGMNGSGFVYGNTTSVMRSPGTVFTLSAVAGGGGNGGGATASFYGSVAGSNGGTGSVSVVYVGPLEAEDITRL